LRRSDVVLREVESEAFEIAKAVGDFKAATRTAYAERLGSTAAQMDGIKSVVGHELIGLVV
jgi:hypothetical protein